MKKLLSLLILTSMLLFMLCSCHGSDGMPEFKTPRSLDLDEPIEITFWAKSDTNKAMADVYRDAIKSFEALYPNVTVKMKLYNDYGRIYNDVITNISTNTTPNVCITYPDHIATYITGKNIVVPLDEVMNDEKI